MKVLITGGAGFIGSHIADEAIRQGHEVVIVDNLSNGDTRNLNPVVKFYAVDILAGDFRRVVESEKPKVIYHEAAQPSLRRSIECPDEDAEVNIIGTIRVIQAAQAVGAHLMFASTSAVYAPDAVTPFYETDLHNPNLPYGIAKHASELYICHSGVSYTILRYGNVYGPRQKPIGENQLIPHCIRFLKGQEPNFAINGDGEQKRDFVFVRDIARANLMIRTRGTFNVGTGVGTSVNCLCQMLADIAGQPNCEFPHRDPKPGEAKASILAIQSVKQTGWKPLTVLEQGLRETWERWQ